MDMIRKLYMSFFHAIKVTAISQQLISHLSCRWTVPHWTVACGRVPLRWLRDSGQIQPLAGATPSIDSYTSGNGWWRLASRLRVLNPSGVIRMMDYVGIEIDKFYRLNSHHVAKTLADL